MDKGTGSLLHKCGSSWSSLLLSLHYWLGNGRAEAVIRQTESRCQGWSGGGVHRLKKALTWKISLPSAPVEPFLLPERVQNAPGRRKALQNWGRQSRSVCCKEPFDGSQEIQVYLNLNPTLAA